MRRARGCPIPPAAPRMATLRSGTEEEEEEKLRRRSDCFADEEERTITDLNILEMGSRVYSREGSKS